MSPEESSTQWRSGLEPELGGDLRAGALRSGYEPELGGLLRQRGVYVDEVTCIGCGLCAYIARNTFYLEPDYGRSRVVRQNGDSEELVEEAIDSCPVDCIHRVDYTDIPVLEDQRRFQQIPAIGLPPTAHKLKRRRAAPARKPRT